MLINNDVEHIKFLYENIFQESADNSKEFIIFVDGNPHSLRFKIEDWLEDHRNFEFQCRFMNYSEQEIHALMGRIASAYELDAFITNYIENHND